MRKENLEKAYELNKQIEELKAQYSSIEYALSLERSECKYHIDCIILSSPCNKDPMYLNVSLISTEELLKKFLVLTGHKLVDLEVELDDLL